jgi:hypothetical protein
VAAGQVVRDRVDGERTGVTYVWAARGRWFQGQRMVPEAVRRTAAAGPMEPRQRPGDRWSGARTVSRFGSPQGCPRRNGQLRLGSHCAYFPASARGCPRHAPEGDFPGHRIPVLPEPCRENLGPAPCEREHTRKLSGPPAKPRQEQILP